MDSNMVRADFWQRNDLPKKFKQIQNSFMRTPREACMDSNMVNADFWQRNDLPQSSNKYRTVLCERRGTHALALKHAAPRLRGLRLGLQTRAGHGPDGAHANRYACRAVEKFCRASSAGGRRRLQKNFANWIVSVAEDCLSPAESFHGCSLMHFRGCLRGCIRSSNRWLEICGYEFVDLAESGVTIRSD